jgi:DNA polymerase III subunit alpha
MPDFVHLHSHTAYSLLDGAMSPDQYVSAIKERGMNACAVTDHGFMYALPEFQKACDKHSVKPIHGCEFYLVRDIAQAKAAKTRADLRDLGRYHQLLLAKNEEGLKNLYRLNSYAATEGMRYNPLIDLKILGEHSEGLIATSTCMQGIIPQTLLQKNKPYSICLDEAEVLINWFKEHFGDDFYLEAHRHGIPEEETILQALPILSQRTGVKIVTANDCHYVNKEDYTLQDALVCISRNDLLSDTARFKIAHENLEVKTPQQMVDLFPEFPNATEVSCEIADKVSARLDLSGKVYHFPTYRIQGVVVDPDAELTRLCALSFLQKYPNPTEEIKQRVRYELDIIKRLGFSGYFLIVADIRNAAREMGVIVGPGRGSAAGSIVSYLLGITGVDPLEYGLLFERFLNPDRVSMPDIDVDFDSEGRKRVIDYIVDTYGKDRVAQICTITGLKAKNGLLDFARIMAVNAIDIHTVTKKIPPNQTLQDKPLTEMIEEVPDLKELRDHRDPDVRKVYGFAERAHGYARHTGVHPAGVVITPGPLQDYVPIRKDPNSGAIMTQFEGAYLDDLGLLKIDVLGLKTLSVVQHTIRLIEESGRTFDPKVLEDYTDPQTFELFAAGDTFGVFQFESEGMREWLKRLKPTSLDDLTAMNALYRPGPMGQIPSYVARKHGREAVDYPHPSVKEILIPTYGIMVYQEQVMRIAQDMSGYKMSEADSLRKAIGKKKKSEMDLHESKFVEGAVSRGVDREVAQQTWDHIKKFAEYAFNKSHALAYSILAYRTGYLKRHYPLEFMTATLENEEVKHRMVFISDTVRRGIEVLPPDINKSQEGFTIETTPEGYRAIRFGLGSIKKVGASAKTILRKRDRPYLSFEDFRARTGANAGACKSLIVAGAFDSLGETRAALMDWCEDLIQYQTKEKKYRQNIAAKPTGRYKEPEAPLKPVREEWPKGNRLYRELEVTGAFVSGHPLDPYLEVVEMIKRQPTVDNGNRVYHQIPVSIMEVKERMTKKGKAMWFVKVHDGEREYEVSMFSESQQQYGAFIGAEQDILMIGSYGQGSFSDRFTLEAAQPLEEVLRQWTKIVHVQTDDPLAIDRVGASVADQDHGGAEVWVTSNGDTYKFEHVRISPTTALLKKLRSIGKVSLA